MDLRGQRFEVDLSDDDIEKVTGSILGSSAMPSIPSAFVADIKERSTAPPTAPKLKSTPTGFPEHKKRTRMSAFKRQRGGSSNLGPAGSHNAFALPTSKSANFADLTQNNSILEESDRRRIDEENRQRLDAMSAEEIQEEREALLSSLDPTLIQRILMRANLDEGRGDTGIEPPSQKIQLDKEKYLGNEPKEVDENFTSPKPGEDNSPTKSQEKTEGTPAPKPSGRRIELPKSLRWEDDNEPANPINLQPASEKPSGDVSELLPPEVHFPSAPRAPDLDPSDPSFLENLHTKYFPDLPADPSKLAWMAPIPTRGSVADQESPYNPAHEAIPASALRFDFRGGIIPPRMARAIPTTKGLHHHGEAPEAAGYTIPELARLARSAFPAQRCIAFQTLGRLLYRLGRGEWGDEDSEVAKGLWRCVEEGKITRTLEEASTAEGGHQGCKTYAIEAVWLWQKGGGKVWKAS